MKNWYKNVRIDSFSKGSVLVDYFVELADVPRDINTQEIKQMFHDALIEVPMTVVPLRNATVAPIDIDGTASELNNDVKPIKSNYLMGQFILDPVSTDFIGNLLNISPPKMYVEFNLSILFKQLFQNNVLCRPHKA